MEDSGMSACTIIFNCYTNKYSFLIMNIQVLIY